MLLLAGVSWPSLWVRLLDGCGVAGSTWSAWLTHPGHCPGGAGAGKTRVVTKAEPRESFFNFFGSPGGPESPEDDDEEDPIDVEAAMYRDFEVSTLESVSWCPLHHAMVLPESTDVVPALTSGPAC